MFKVGNIYKFSCNESRSVREYITDDGTVCPDVLIQERCIPEKAQEDGYYKVLKINGECAIKDNLGAIRYYDMDIEWEKVVDLGWQDRLRTVRFFRKIKELGFYIVEKDIEKNHPLDNNSEWFAIDIKRGIIAHGTSINRMIRNPVIKLLYPSENTLRKMIFQYYDPNIQENQACDVSVTITQIGPNIFDLMKNHQMSIENAKTKDLFECDMPFVEFDLPVRENINDYNCNVFPFWSNELSKPIQKNKAYFTKCRKVFENFPKDVQNFLREYSNVETKYLRGEPWKQYERFIDEYNDYYGYVPKS